jgi:poly(A) polymerase
MPGSPVVTAAAMRRLRLSNAQRDRVTEAVIPAPEIGPTMTPRAARRRLYEIGQRGFIDRLMLAWAERGGEGDEWLALLRLAREWVRPKFPLTGHDAAAAGLKPGPDVGEALRRVEAFWVEHDFQPEKPALLRQLAR